MSSSYGDCSLPVLHEVGASGLTRHIYADCSLCTEFRGGWWCENVGLHGTGVLFILIEIPSRERERWFFDLTNQSPPGVVMMMMFIAIIAKGYAQRGNGN